MSQLELSIIVPILNELQQLPELLSNLQHQQQVNYELLVVDGGSVDGGPEWLQQHPPAEGTRLLSSPRGRGRQLNCGAQQAAGEWLLFLHVDSRFEDPLAFRNAIDLLHEAGSQKLAGHFALKFRRRDKTPSAGYYYYEWKARLGRPETIHGDQGFLLRRSFFLQLEGFRDDLPVMEDTDFAERLRATGQWRLLPAEISTSARRFETEGLWQRQLLGSLLMCFRTIGWQQYFAAAPGVYRQQAETGKLQVRPFFVLISQLFVGMERKAAWQLWWQSGCYVRGHAWQLVFALDARRAFQQGVPVGQAQPLLTDCFEPLYNFVTDNTVGRFAATLLLRVWFFATSNWLFFKERNSTVR